MVANLRRRAVELSFAYAGQPLLGFHAFRRGRARDEYRAGTPISKILELGGWRSPSVLRYLAIREIDQLAVISEVVDASESE